MGHLSIARPGGRKNSPDPLPELIKLCGRISDEVLRDRILFDVAYAPSHQSTARYVISMHG